MRLLIVANVCPYPIRGGIHLRLLHLLERIARHHQVTLCCHTWAEEDKQGADELGRRGIRTFTGPLSRTPGWPQAWQAALNATRGIPPELALYRSSELMKAIRQLVMTEQFDILQVEEPILAHYLHVLPANARVRRVLTFHNVHFMQARRIAGIEQGHGIRIWRKFTARCMQHFEPKLAASVDRAIAVSLPDRDALISRDPNLNVHVVPNGVDTRALHPLPPSTSKPSLLFVGALSYRPCEDAVLWLAQQILPLVWRRYPNVEAWIVGHGPTQAIRRLTDRRIHVTGTVPDVTPYYQAAHVAVVPLRAGGGSRLKILEAMALGRPVVSTTIGAEGIEAVPGTHLAVANDAEGFAAAVVEVLGNYEMARQMVGNARTFVEKNHDWDQVADVHLEIYRELMINPI